MKRITMDRFIDTIEWIAAGFVGIVAADIFCRVLLRNLFNYAIPDAFDFGRLLLGILIFWGIAATSYRGGHITVDLIWANVGPKYQRMIDVFAHAGARCSWSRCRPTRCSTRCAAPITTMSSPSICGCRPGRSSRSPGPATSPPCC